MINWSRRKQFEMEESDTTTIPTSLTSSASCISVTLCYIADPGMAVCGDDDDAGAAVSIDHITLP